MLTSFSAQCNIVLDELSRGPSQPSQQQQQASTTSTAGVLPSAVANTALRTLADLDEQLARLANKAIEHDENARRIQQLEDALVQYDHAWREQVMDLEAQRVKLAALTLAGKTERESIETAKKGGYARPRCSEVLTLYIVIARLKPSTILSYARLLAPYTSAPPRSLFPGGNAPDSLASLPPGSILPFPTEEIMRRGRLAFTQMAEIGETAPQTGGTCLVNLRRACVDGHVHSQTSISLRWRYKQTSWPSRAESACCCGAFGDSATQTARCISETGGRGRLCLRSRSKSRCVTTRLARARPLMSLDNQIYKYYLITANGFWQRPTLYHASEHHPVHQLHSLRMRSTFGCSSLLNVVIWQ